MIGRGFDLVHDPAGIPLWLVASPFPAKSPGLDNHTHHHYLVCRRSAARVGVDLCCRDVEPARTDFCASPTGLPGYL